MQLLCVRKVESSRTYSYLSPMPAACRKNFEFKSVNTLILQCDHFQSVKLSLKRFWNVKENAEKAICLRKVVLEEVITYSWICVFGRGFS